VTSTPNQIISWANKAAQRGTTATLAADNQTINLNAPGVYEITVSASGSTTAAGTFGFQLNGDGAAISRATASMTTGAGDTGSVSFATLVTVTGTYISGTKAAITLTYTGSAGEISNVTMIAKKVA